MKLEHSLILDLLRFFAAVLVFIHHSEQVFDAPVLSPFASFGHDSVLFFFILSGFVISYVTHTKRTYFFNYLAARLSRVYSIAIPSIALVLFLAFMQYIVFPANEKVINLSSPTFYSAILNSILFLNYTVFGEGTLPTNGPYWSLSYEVFYYFIFGVFVYFSGPFKWALIAILTLVAGIKIIILLPIWMLGCLLFMFYEKLKTRTSIGLIIMLIPSLAYSLFRYLNLDDIIYHFSKETLYDVMDFSIDSLEFSKRFLSDYVLASIFIIMFIGIFNISDLYKNLVIKHNNQIRFLASLSFPIYLFHYPIILFFRNCSGNQYLYIAISFLLSATLGYYAEKFKGIYYETFFYLLTDRRRPKR